MEPAPSVSETEAACMRVNTSGMRMSPTAPTIMKHAAENDEAAAQPLAREIEAHGSSSPAWPRAPKRKNFSTANVPMMFSIA